jgi:hypothetical protein
MATRAIKKLTKKDDIEILKDNLNNNSQSSDDQDDDDQQIIQTYKPNSFNLVNKNIS